MAPRNCFLGTPKKPEDFLNQCSTGFLPNPGAPTGDECLSFDNCKYPAICDKNADGGADSLPALMGPPTADAGIATDTGTVVPDDSNLPACQDAAANRGSVVTISGSSNFLALLAKIAPILYKEKGLTLVFKTTDSCTGARSMYPCLDGPGQSCKGGFSARDHFISDPAKGSGGAYAQYFDATGPHDCLLGESVPVDVGESEISVETCNLQRDDLRVRHTPGPILPILFVVPRNSPQAAISAEAAREIFGNGGHVDPWLKPEYFFVRGPGTATTRLIGKAIDVPVPPNRFWGIDQGTAQKLATYLRGIMDPETAPFAIGLLGADSYDADRFNLKALAFKAKGQTCAYVPDSALGSFDKRNVRDGHYPIWGTIHFFTAVVEGAPVSAAGDVFVSFMSLVPRPDALQNAFVDSGWIPECAMQVQHQNDLTDPITSRPTNYPCGCYFESRVPGGKTPSGCRACVTDSDCTDSKKPICDNPTADNCVDPKKPICNFHYCEAAPPN